MYGVYVDQIYKYSSQYTFESTKSFVIYNGHLPTIININLPVTFFFNRAFSINITTSLELLVEVKGIKSHNTYKYVYKN